VTAGVHHARNLGCVGHVFFILNGEGVHIGADGDDGVTLSPLRHHPGAAHSSADTVAQRLQYLCHAGGGARFLKAQFGVYVKFPSPGD